MSIKSVMLSNHLILCHPLILLPWIFPSIQVFSNESSLHIRWPKYWSFSFSISPSNVYSALISFRIDWFDLLAVQGTLRSFLQHHSSKAPILLYLANNVCVFSVISDSLRSHGLSIPGFPDLHHPLEFAQIHVQWVGDAIQPSHPLPPPSPFFALSLSQNQGLFQCVGSSHQVTKVLELHLQH